MKKRTRSVLTAVSAAYLLSLATVGRQCPWGLFIWLLVAAVVPLVWLLWAFASWSATQHSKRWERDIAKVHRIEAREAVRR